MAAATGSRNTTNVCCTHTYATLLLSRHDDEEPFAAFLSIFHSDDAQKCDQLLIHAVAVRRTFFWVKCTLKYA
jgi:hypothetical protein